MAVVRNLLIRVGADYSAARQALQGATREVARFKRDTQKNLDEISGRRGFGQLNSQFRELSRSVSSSLSQMRGANGIGGVVMALGELRPALSAATTGLRGFGAAAGAAGASAGVAGLAIAGLTAAVAAAVYALYRVSQPAVQFEADLGRLNMQLRGSTYEFMRWARAQGLATSTAANMGATYGTLLSSFISDNRELGRQTQELVHATRVVASATGRTIEDVTERIRSGLLGNTEAIEDLGIFVNVAMIESTDAFKRFANGRHWDELDFRVQQQIRLAAILEQAYARYGNELQQNVMTKQTLLTEQLKQVKLNLSQAFLPIWDAVLPALIRLAEALAVVTENLARFTYWLRGWDYDERMRGTQQYTDAVIDQGRAYDELATSARKARGELAAFDRLNLIGFGSGVGGGTGGGGAGGGSPGGFTPDGGGRGRIDLPEFPPELTRRWRIEFDPPHPPDAGIGAVATAVTNTVNNLIAQIKTSLQQMWNDLQVQTQAGAVGQSVVWGEMARNISGVLVPDLVVNVGLNWQNMWNQLRAQTEAGRAALIAQLSQMYAHILHGSHVATEQVRMDWQTMLDAMRQIIATQVPAISMNWNVLKQNIESIRAPFTNVRTDWVNTLTHMLNQLKANTPAINLGWASIGLAIQSVTPELYSLQSAWNSVLNNLKSTANEILGGIITKVNDVINAWNRFKQTLGAIPKAITDAVTPNTRSDLPGRNLPVIGYGLRGLDAIGEFVEDSGIGSFLRGTIVPGAGGVGNVGKTLQGATATVRNAMKSLAELLEGWGIAVPAFAAGGIVHGPTIAMVGEYAGASANPEVIAPLSDLEDMLDDGEQVAVLRQILQAIRENLHITVTISEREMTNAVIRGHNSIVRQTGRTPFMI